jgi:integrase
MSRVRKVVNGCEFATPSEINAEVVETFIRELAAKKNLGPRTYNHYLQAAQEFTKWLFRTGRASTNPLLGLDPLNCEVDIRHKRRALSAEEVAKLVQSARVSGEEIQCFDGETRARIYLLSYMTGLRKKELSSLTPRSFSLDATPPTLTVEAPASKNRKRAVLPLHPELVAMVREWLVGVPDDQFLFPNLDRRRGYLMVKKDLERVGIPYENADGIADFHAAGRHTHITELLRNGASLPEAKELARHSDVRQTMKYTHIGIDDQAKAIRRLPWHQIGTNPGVPDCPAQSTRDTTEERTTATSPDDKGTSVSSRHTRSTPGNRGRKRPVSFDSRRLHFLEKEALRRERRRAFSLWGIELRRRACSSIG